MNQEPRRGKIIDLELGMKRLRSTQPGPALEALRILFETLKEDVATVRAAEHKNDRLAAETILCKIDCGDLWISEKSVVQGC